MKNTDYLILTNTVDISVVNLLPFNLTLSYYHSIKKYDFFFFHHNYIYHVHNVKHL